MSTIFIVVIEFYQRYLSFDTGILRVLAPGGACKYSVRCSEYTKQKIREYGALKGSMLGIKRIWSCR